MDNPLDNGKENIALATLAAAAGLVIGANRDKVAELLGPPVRGIGKTAGAAATFVLAPVRGIGRTAGAAATFVLAPVRGIGKAAGGAATFVLAPVRGIGRTAGAAFGGAAKFVVQQKEALEDKLAEARVKTVVPEG